VLKGNAFRTVGKFCYEFVRVEIKYLRVNLWIVRHQKWKLCCNNSEWMIYSESICFRFLGISSWTERKKEMKEDAHNKAELVTSLQYSLFTIVYKPHQILLVFFYVFSTGFTSNSNAQFNFSEYWWVDIFISLWRFLFAKIQVLKLNIWGPHLIRDVFYIQI